MGTRGPVPERTETLLGHRSKAELESVTRAPAAENVVIPEPDENWHPTAYKWYESLKDSGQSRFYESSDWATAHYIAEAMSRNLKYGKFSAQLFAAVMSGMSNLLVTEGDRRRVRLELERKPKEDGELPAGVAAINDYRRSLASG